MYYNSLTQSRCFLILKHLLTMVYTQLTTFGYVSKLHRFITKLTVMCCLPAVWMQQWVIRARAFALPVLFILGGRLMNMYMKDFDKITQDASPDSLILLKGPYGWSNVWVQPAEDKSTYLITCDNPAIFTSAPEEVTEERMEKILDVTVEHIYAHNYDDANVLHLLSVVMGMLEQYNPDLTTEELLEQYHSLHLTRGNQEDEHE